MKYLFLTIFIFLFGCFDSPNSIESENTSSALSSSSFLLSSSSSSQDSIKQDTVALDTTKEDNIWDMNTASGWSCISPRPKNITKDTSWSVEGNLKILPFDSNLEVRNQACTPYFEESLAYTFQHDSTTYTLSFGLNQNGLGQLKHINTFLQNKVKINIHQGYTWGASDMGISISDSTGLILAIEDGFQGRGINTQDIALFGAQSYSASEYFQSLSCGTTNYTYLNFANFPQVQLLKAEQATVTLNNQKYGLMNINSSYISDLSCSDTWSSNSWAIWRKI